MRISLLPAIALTLALWAGQACATSPRVWVSGHGVDSAGCGARTAPCRSLQWAHDREVNDGGEIDILDPAGYGSINISMGVSIVNDGVGTAGVQATTGAAITINAAQADAVYLRGLNIDGVKFAAQTGIAFNSGGHLTIDSCIVRHFGGDGVKLAPTTAVARILIENTESQENGLDGIAFIAQPGETNVSGVLDKVIAANESVGVSMSANGQTEPTLSFSVHDASVTGNNQFGIDVDATGAALTIDVDSSYVSQNGSDGFRAKGGVLAHLSRSAFNQNGASAVVNITSGGGAIFTTGDNPMLGNPSGPVSGPMPTHEGLN